MGVLLVILIMCSQAHRSRTFNRQRKCVHTLLLSAIAVEGARGVRSNGLPNAFCFGVVAKRHDVLLGLSGSPSWLVNVNIAKLFPPGKLDRVFRIGWSI